MVKYLGIELDQLQNISNRDFSSWLGHWYGFGSKKWRDARLQVNQLRLLGKDPSQEELKANRVLRRTWDRDSSHNLTFNVVLSFSKSCVRSKMKTTTATYLNSTKLTHSLAHGSIIKEPHSRNTTMTSPCRKMTKLNANDFTSSRKSASIGVQLTVLGILGSNAM
jgi:hypothetical protein